jgi:GNAT superfamily N-acetyltransferase
MNIRPARPGDESVILDLLRELAEYENLLGIFAVSEEVVARDYLSADPACFCELAYVGDEPAGIATWYRNYSSFAALRGIYIEDLFVRPVWRGRGIGKGLLVHLAKMARAEGASRMDWKVLDWNTPSIAFYLAFGAHKVENWLDYRLEGAALEKLAR